MTSLKKFTKKLFIKYPSLTDLRLIKEGNHVIYIASIEIDEKQRNKGYGSIILGEIVQTYKDKIVLLKPIKNGRNTISKKLISFYEKNGFKKHFIDDELYMIK